MASGGNSTQASPATNGQSHQKGEGDEDGQVMNNLMSDIQNGFVHRRLPDGGFKVRGQEFFSYLQADLMTERREKSYMPSQVMQECHSCYRNDNSA